MRRGNKHQMIEQARERGSRRGKLSQAARRNERLASALEFEPARPAESFLVFELATRNPRTEVTHYLEIRHEVDDGTDRFNVYLDGDKWRNGWSRSRFCGWLFKQIDSVRVDWN